LLTSIEAPLQKHAEIRKIRRYAIICALLWTTLISGLLFVDFTNNNDSVIEIGRSMAQASFEENALFRRWAASHESVYVPETAATPANPYLSHVPERDIISPSGKRLTLAHPAFITRQLFEIARENKDLPQGHITSLNPIRPDNAPDLWESKALKQLERGSKEVVAVEQLNGQPHLRFMRPLITEKSCLRCHAALGDTEGGIRGGISITLSLASIQKTMKSVIIYDVGIYSFIWLLGLGLIYIGTRKIERTMTSLSNERNMLRESEEQLRVIFETTESGIILVSPQGVIDFANRRMAEMFGMPLQELIGTSYPEHLHESEKQIGDEKMRQLIKGEIQSVSVDRKYIRTNGSEFWGHLSGRRLEHPDGGLRALVGVITDVTERKRIDVECRVSEERYRALFTRAGDGIFIMSSNGQLVEVNESFARMHGYNVREMQHMNLQDLDTPETFSMAQKRIALMLAGETLTFEVEHYHKDGHIFSLEVSGSLISSGAESYIQCFHRDISERRQAEEERRKLEQQFHHAQKLESLGVLAGGIAHDFNNILTVILGHCYLAKGDLDSEQEYKESFQQVESAANRAADLCRQMLTYAGKTESVHSWLSLWTLVDEVVKMLQSAIRKNVMIELDLNCNVPAIMGDTGQLQQIVMNLIINAAEAIGEANGNVHVVLSQMVVEENGRETDTFGTVISAGSYACLEVTDTGIGMDEETLKRIFEPFYTTKFTGRGLGMSAIQGIVKSHDGILKLTSAPGIGTTFKVCFPLPKLSDEAITTRTSRTHHDKATGTVLLVDDEKILLDMGTSLLDAFGFSTITAQNGFEAIEIYRERGDGIDFVLLDLIMPIMGGIETYHELRNITTTLPIIFCSGYSIESVSDIIDTDKHSAFVHKPYNPEELRNVVMGTKGQNQEMGESV
jgi:PAS domain S-box-containing protein